MVSLRNFVKSVATVLPEIPKPVKKPTLTEKFIWTGGALVIYMIMSITPLYHFGNQQDQFAFLRIIFASTQGTLTDDSLWGNELHPTGKGFAQIAEKFRAALNSHFGSLF